jgi:hypothetical protein
LNDCQKRLLAVLFLVEQALRTMRENVRSMMTEVKS